MNESLDSEGLSIPFGGGQYLIGLISLGMNECLLIRKAYYLLSKVTTFNSAKKSPLGQSYAWTIICRSDLGTVKVASGCIWLPLEKAKHDALMNLNLIAHNLER